MLDYERSIAEPDAAPDVGWADWASGSTAPVVQIAQIAGPDVTGWAETRRFGGIFVRPASSVLDLETRRHEIEGTIDLRTGEERGERAPYSLFEIEKLIRMMLRQSGLAFELLVSPLRLTDCEPSPCEVDGRWIAEQSVSRELVTHYREVADGLFGRVFESEITRPDLVLDLLRTTLTGRMLCRGRVCLDLDRLLEWRGDEDWRRLAGAARRGLRDGWEGEGLARVRDEIEATVRGIDPRRAEDLPESPRGWETLSGWLVDARRAE
ncbi:MAG: DNA polymerase beta superfamily protein [Bradymonadaceae bacterium]